MTTNVYDQSKLLITSDSRWSILTDFGVIYVDDTGFDKIEISKDHAFVFAGNAGVIQLWKDYIRASQAGIPLARPSAKGISLLVAKMGCGSFVEAYGQDISLPSKAKPVVSFAGTGSHPAAVCWFANKCGKRAIDSAKARDYYSGGTVSFLELNTRVGNQQNNRNADKLSEAFLDKGMVMYTPGITSSSVPLTQAAASDPRVAEWLKKIAEGSVEIQAPCDSMFAEPTEEENSRLDAAMASIFG